MEEFEDDLPDENMCASGSSQNCTDSAASGSVLPAISRKAAAMWMISMESSWRRSRVSVVASQSSTSLMYLERAWVDGADRNLRQCWPGLARSGWRRCFAEIGGLELVVPHRSVQREGG